MKYIFLTLFIVQAALAAPLEESHEEILGFVQPEIEEGVIDVKVAPEIEAEADSKEETDGEEKDAEAAFFGMMNPMSYMNPMMGMGGMNPMMGMGGMNYPMMDPMMGMGGMNYPMMGMGGMNYPMMDPMMGMGGMNYPMMDPMMGMGGMNYPMMDPMMGMGGMNPMMGMGGMPMPFGMDYGMNPMMNMNPMGYDQNMHMNPFMMGMGGMNQMPMQFGMNPMSMNIPPVSYEAPKHPDQVLGKYNEYKNEDFPTDYTLPCSNHCACEQMCAKSFAGPCNCRCPPRCTPGLL